MFVVTVNFVVAPEFEQDFAVAMAEQARNSLHLEPDCHVFDVCVSVDNSCSFFLYELYTDSAAFDAHLKSEHFESFNDLVTPWVESKSVGSWFRTEVSS